MISARGRASAGRLSRLPWRNVFPGDRRVWLVAGGVFSLALIGVLIALLRPHQDLLGTNSVGARSAVALVPANTPLCVPHLRVPTGTGQVRFNLQTPTPRPALEVQVREQGGSILRGISRASPAGGHEDYAIALPTLRSSQPWVFADVCLTARAPVFAYGNDNIQDNVPSPTLGGVAIPQRVGVWFLGPPGAQRSIISQMGEMFRRAALFRPGFVGEWTYWVLLFVIFPALAYTALRLIATADEDRRRRMPIALTLGIVAFGVAGSWALITPAFLGPDESEHFGYVQYFAETGEAVQTAQTARPPYSDAEGFALEAVFHTSVIERSETRPPWIAAGQTQYQQQAKILHLPQNNGGGYHPAISPHTPAYYSLLTPAYFLTRSSIFSELFAMRLTSALMGALTAVLAMLLVLELLPGRRALAVCAGLLVAFEPMFSFISGAVNNDNGVNLAAALLIYLVVRAMVRGLRWPLALAIGATFVAAPLMKATAYELFPAALIAVGFAMWRRHGSRNWLALAAGAGTFALLELAWGDVSHTLHHAVFTTPGGGTPGETFEALHYPKRYISWLARVLLPFKAPFINHNWTIIHWPFFNVYIERGFASFGWTQVEFPKWVYIVIVASVAAALVLGVRVLWRERQRVFGIRRGFAPEVIVLVLVPVVVICAVEAAFEPSLGILPILGTPESGRYAFPAIAAVAALAIGACYGLGRKRVLPLATGLVAAMIALNFASQLLSLSAFYT